MFSVRSLLLASVLTLAAPVVFAAQPLVEITKGPIQSKVGARLYDQPANPFAGSLTGPSLAQAQETLSRVPGATDVVPAEQYNKKYATSFKEILANTPGVFVQPRFGEEVRLSIRGSCLSRGFHLRGITVLQDGVPINLSDDSGDFQEIDPLISRYTEVYKGGAAMPFGASSLGGAINVVTPTGHTAIAPNQLSFETGSYDTYRAHGSVARVIGNTDFFASVTGLNSRGFRAQSAQEKGRFNGNIGYRLSDNAETRFYLTYNDLQQEVPGTMTLRQALDAPRSVLPINELNDYQRNIRSIRAANKTTFTFGDKVLETSFYTAYKDLFHPIFQVIDQESEDYGAFARLSGHHDIAGHQNKYQLGVHGKVGHINALQFTNVNGSRGVKTADNDQNAGQWDVSAENQFFVIPSVALVTGLQYVQSRRDFDNNLASFRSATKDYNSLNPKLGGIWDVTKSVQVFGNISRSSEAPTFSELVQQPVVGFVPLDLQTAWTAEIGTRGSHQNVAWDLTAYRSRVDGELLNFTTNPLIPAATFNADRTLHQGIEAGFDWRFVPRWTIRQVYNLNDFKFQNDTQFGDNRLAGVPRQQYRAELHYEDPKGWSVTPNLEAVEDGGYVDYANTFQAPAYAILGINATATVRDGVTLFVDGRNLLDKRYVSNYSTIATPTPTNTAVFYPGEGRQVFGGIKVSF